jgi:hypothetical protein
MKKSVPFDLFSPAAAALLRSLIIVGLLAHSLQSVNADTIGTDVSLLEHLTPFLKEFMSTATFMDLEHVDGSEGWTDTWSKNRAGATARPFVVELSSNSDLIWNQTKWNCRQVVQDYGNRYILYQHLGDGTATGETTEMWDGVALSDATKTMEFCLKTQNKTDIDIDIDSTAVTFAANNRDNNTDNGPVDIPVYFNTRSDRRSAQALHADLDAADLRKKTPVYVEANTADPIGRQMLDSLLEDETLRLPPLPDGLSKSSVQSFMYIGGLFSGTYMHQHGSACLYSDGPKLWFLLNKTGMCSLRGPPTIPRHLPQRCPARSDECIENIHPLEILQHYEELRELGIAPFLHLQRAGEVFCFPERWFHGTINLGPTVAPAFVLDRVDTPWYTSNYCEDSQNTDDSMSVEEDAGDIDQELTDEELKMWISASGDSDLADAVGLEGVQGFSGDDQVGYTFYMNEGIAALVTHRIHESIEYFNQAIEVAEPESIDLWRAHMTLARAYADSLTSEEFLCHEVANTSSAQHDLYTKAMFNANIAANGLVGNAELAMIIADLHIAAGNVLEALPLVASAVETWFATYENEEEYPHYLDDPMWIVGTVSMAVSLARRAGEADLASSWFWKAKSFSGMFQWQYPTQSPGNLNWFPQPPMEGNIEVPGW